MAVMAASAAILSACGSAQAQRLENHTAIFSGIDKITGHITTFSALMDETVRFGQLEITPRICYSRPITQRPKTSSFVEINEIVTARKNFGETEIEEEEIGTERRNRIFTGWMFAESPGLNAVEHAVNDVWLIDCRDSVNPAFGTETETQN